jgi:hypothetical protein
MVFNGSAWVPAGEKQGEEAFAMDEFDAIVHGSGASDGAAALPIDQRGRAAASASERDAAVGAAIDRAGSAAVDRAGSAAVDRAGSAAVDRAGSAAVDRAGSAAVDASTGVRKGAAMRPPQGHVKAPLPAADEEDEDDWDASPVVPRAPAAATSRGSGHEVSSGRVGPLALAASADGAPPGATQGASLGVGVVGAAPESRLASALAAFQDDEDDGGPAGQTASGRVGPLGGVTTQGGHAAVPDLASASRLAALARANLTAAAPPGGSSIVAGGGGSEGGWDAGVVAGGSGGAGVEAAPSLPPSAKGGMKTLTLADLQRLQSAAGLTGAGGAVAGTGGSAAGVSAAGAAAARQGLRLLAAGPGRPAAGGLLSVAPGAPSSAVVPAASAAAWEEGSGGLTTVAGSLADASVSASNTVGPASAGAASRRQVAPFNAAAARAAAAAFGGEDEGVSEEEDWDAAFARGRPLPAAPGGFPPAAAGSGGAAPASPPAGPKPAVYRQQMPAPLDLRGRSGSDTISLPPGASATAPSSSSSSTSVSSGSAPAVASTGGVSIGAASLLPALSGRGTAAGSTRLTIRGDSPAVGPTPHVLQGVQTPEISAPSAPITGSGATAARPVTASALTSALGTAGCRTAEPAAAGIAAVSAGAPHAPPPRSSLPEGDDDEEDGDFRGVSAAQLQRGDRRLGRAAMQRAGASHGVARSRVVAPPVLPGVAAGALPQGSSTRPTLAGPVVPPLVGGLRLPTTTASSVGEWPDNLSDALSDTSRSEHVPSIAGGSGSESSRALASSATPDASSGLAVLGAPDAAAPQRQSTASVVAAHTGTISDGSDTRLAVAKAAPRVASNPMQAAAAASADAGTRAGAGPAVKSGGIASGAPDHKPRGSGTRQHASGAGSRGASALGGSPGVPSTAASSSSASAFKLTDAQKRAFAASEAAHRRLFGASVSSLSHSVAPSFASSWSVPLMTPFAGGTGMFTPVQGVFTPSGSAALAPTAGGGSGLLSGSHALHPSVGSALASVTPQGLLQGQHGLAASLTASAAFAPLQPLTGAISALAAHPSQQLGQQPGSVAGVLTGAAAGVLTGAAAGAPAGSVAPLLAPSASPPRPMPVGAGEGAAAAAQASAPVGLAGEASPVVEAAGGAPPPAGKLPPHAGPAHPFTPAAGLPPRPPHTPAAASALSKTPSPAVDRAGRAAASVSPAGLGDAARTSPQGGPPSPAGSVASSAAGSVAGSVLPEEALKAIHLPRTLSAESQKYLADNAGWLCKFAPMQLEGECSAGAGSVSATHARQSQGGQAPRPPGHAQRHSVGALPSAGARAASVQALAGSGAAGTGSGHHGVPERERASTIGSGHDRAAVLAALQATYPYRPRFSSPLAASAGDSGAGGAAYPFDGPRTGATAAVANPFRSAKAGLSVSGPLPAMATASAAAAPAGVHPRRHAISASVPGGVGRGSVGLVPRGAHKQSASTAADVGRPSARLLPHSGGGGGARARVDASAVGRAATAPGLQRLLAGVHGWQPSEGGRSTTPTGTVITRISPTATVASAGAAPSATGLGAGCVAGGAPMGATARHFGAPQASHAGLRQERGPPPATPERAATYRFSLDSRQQLQRGPLQRGAPPAAGMGPAYAHPQPPPSARQALPHAPGYIPLRTSVPQQPPAAAAQADVYAGTRAAPYRHASVPAGARSGGARVASEPPVLPAAAAGSGAGAGLRRTPSSTSHERTGTSGTVVEHVVALLYPAQPPFAAMGAGTPSSGAGSVVGSSMAPHSAASSGRQAFALRTSPVPDESSRSDGGVASAEAGPAVHRCPRARRSPQRSASAQSPLARARPDAPRGYALLHALIPADLLRHLPASHPLRGRENAQAAPTERVNRQRSR